MRNLLLASFAVLLAAAAGAQNATAKLYAKRDGDRVLVAVQVTPEPGAWLYDDDPDSGGKPTEVTFGPDTLEWSKPHFPEPQQKSDPLVGQSKVHKLRFVVYAVGTGEDVDPADVTASLTGLACNERMCLPWKVEDLESRGAGSDELWAAFPAALLAGGDEGRGSTPPAAGGAAPAAASGAAAAPGTAADDWQPDLTSEQKVAGRAFARVDGDEVTVAVEIAILPKFHIYHGPDQEDVGPGVGLPTVPTIEGGNVAWGPWTFPTPHLYDPGFGMESTYVHEGRIVLRVTGTATGTFDPAGVRIAVDGQICDDKSCVMFALAPELASGAGPDTLFATATQDAGTTDAVSLTGVPVDGQAPTGEPTQSSRKKEEGLWQFLLLAFGAGVITLLMPCTYPMIPITISFFTKQATARGGNVLTLALVYGVGIVAIFVLIGVLFGPLIVSVAQGWPMNLAIAILFVIFALSLFGMINLQPPAFLMNAAGRASHLGGYFGVFVMGACLVITSFTCTAPFVGSLLGAGAGSSMLRIVLGMGVFGLTMATPFVLLALVPGKLHSLPQAGGWMETLKVFMGFVELGAAMKFFSNADIVLSGSDFVEGDGLISRELFLMSWTAISLVAALYLFGRINLKGENPQGTIGPGRLVGGLASVVFGLYCWLGVQGYQLGGVMTALAPPTHYTGGLIPAFQGGGGPTAPARAVIHDDYDAAVTMAKAEGKLVLANFTGHTCVNCRKMEDYVFPRPAVLGELQHFVEARLHSDASDETLRARIGELIVSIADGIGQPIYVALDPVTGAELGRYEGAALTSGDIRDFVEFLKSARAKRNPS